MSKLTYDQIVEIIQRGEGVIIDNAVYTDLESLPDVAKLVKDEVDVAKKEADLRKIIADANAKLVSLGEVEFKVPDDEPVKTVSDYGALKASAKDAGFVFDKPNPKKSDLEDFLAKNASLGVDGAA